MKKILLFLFLFLLPSNTYGQDIYTIIGFRSNSIEPTFENRSALNDLLYSNYWDQSYSYGQLVMDEVYNNDKYDYIKAGNSWFAGFGYRQYLAKNSNLYSNFTFKYNEESASVYVVDGADINFTTLNSLIDSGQTFQLTNAMTSTASANWQDLYSSSLSLGYGFGHMWDNGLSLELGADFVVWPSQSVWNDFDTYEFPDDNYITYNLKVSYTIGAKSNDNIWTAPLGLHISKPTSNRFMHSSLFDNVNLSSTDLILELPAGYGLVAGAVVVVAAMIGGAGDGYDYSDSGYAWDQFYSSYGILTWRCRDKSNGEFANNSNCSDKIKLDNTWPDK